MRHPIFTSVLTLNVLLAFRSVAAEGISKAIPVTAEAILVWAFFAAAFCAPQLSLLWRIHVNEQPFRPQGLVALLSGVGFLGLCLWLGWFPFQSPRVISEYHFEGAIALLTPWLVLFLTLLAEALSPSAPQSSTFLEKLEKHRKPRR